MAVSVSERIFEGYFHSSSFFSQADVKSLPKLEDERDGLSVAELRSHRKGAREREAAGAEIGS